MITHEGELREWYLDVNHNLGTWELLRENEAKALYELSYGAPPGLEGPFTYQEAEARMDELSNQFIKPDDDEPQGSGNAAWDAIVALLGIAGALALAAVITGMDWSCKKKPHVKRIPYPVYQQSESLDQMRQRHEQERVQQSLNDIEFELSRIREQRTAP